MSRVASYLSSARRLPGVVLFAVALLILTGPRGASAQRAPMTRDEIIALVSPAVGQGYHWGGSTWTTDKSRLGLCVKTPPEGDGCPACTHPAGTVGADCAGLVGKAWQLTRPTAVDVEFRPYSAGDFFSREAEWTRIELADLQRGDAIARASHTVIFDSFLPDGKYLTYEAKGCEWNITHDGRKIAITDPPAWVAIRRLDLADAEPCTEDTCNRHGTCSEGTCSCEASYAGDKCERCAEGLIGYPTCVAPRQNCTPKGRIECGQSFTVTPSDGRSDLAGYGCDAADRSGRELVYQFAPPGTGRARVTLSGGAGTLLALREACSPEACVASGATALDLDYGAEEEFFLVVESSTGSGDATLGIDCDSSSPPWVGDPCDEDADCQLQRSNGERLNGACYRAPSSGQGFCTLACTRGCPDRLPDKAATFCIEDPAAAGSGICVSKAASQNHFCASVPGTISESVPRLNDTATATVCKPSATPRACQGRLTGTLRNQADRVSIAGATISISGMDAAPLSSGVNGAYSSGVLPCGSYTLTVTAAGFLSATLQVVVSDATVTQVTELRALPEDSCAGTGGAEGNVFDGVSEARTLIVGASVALHEGVDSTTGPAVGSFVTGVDGAFVFDGLPAGNYTAVVTAPGYARALANLSVCGGAVAERKEIALTPNQTGQLRVVLEWERPNDLDLHLQLPSGEEIFFDETCRGSLTSGTRAVLDIDRLEATGPETITVGRFDPGTYTFFVHNFSAQNDRAEGFEQSEARVVVFGADNVEIARFVVPAAGAGYFWDVFSLQGADPARLIPIQSLNDDRANAYDEYTQRCAP